MQLSDPGAGPSNTIQIGPLGGPDHRSPRIHFPVEVPQSRPHKPWNSGLETSPAAGPSTGHRSSLSGSHDSSRISKDSRRRVVSVDAGHGSSSAVKPRRAPAVSMGPSSQRITSQFADSKESDSASWGLSSFSDEYDLSHEDPRILQDVQRALKLKYRREARAKSGQFNTSGRLEHGSTSSQSSTSPSKPYLPPASPPSESVAKTKPPATDIDFSPSTRPSTVKVESHPIPFSSDEGQTLDWSGYTSDDERSERRWKLSVSKRKGKERELILSADEIKRQEGLHTAKLSRIKTLASQMTSKKVAITSDQLSRRYNLVYSSLSSGSDRFNLLKVARWWGNQESLVRSSLEKAEPFPWLKHLEKRGPPNPERMPWHLSALIMEEYLHAQNARNLMNSIPEHPISPEGSAVSLSSSPQFSLPTFPSPSRASSSRFSLSRHISAEGRVSFEPLIEPSRPSFESQRSADSAFSSVFSGSSAQNRAAAPGVLPSPTSSRIHLRDEVRKRFHNDSDGASSAHNSLAEHSDDDPNKARAGRNPTLPSIPSVPVATAPEALNSSAPFMEDSQQEASHADVAEVTAKPDNEKTAATNSTAQNAPRFINRRAIRVSLPSEDRIALALEKRRKQEADEARADMEYEQKSQLVSQYKTNNNRMRALLNRIATDVREYEMCQSSFMTSLGLPTKGLPQDLLEAFSHDPAAVTSSTRRLKSYRAVDDIHHRLVRQRSVFAEFLSQESQPNSGGFPVTKDLLKDPIKALMETLQVLERHRKAMSSREKEVSNVLRNTQTTHAAVKSDYNSTLAHTSVVYPELSQIIALEESYKDQYQHIWEIGMDALTFILDTVTPFWRTYGKTIGDDVQDFLIIPLYRNEFTGEAKRYPIKRLPRRSFRHWVGLMVFFGLTISVISLQARTALSCSINYKLRQIPYDGLRYAALPVFWISIVIQWLAVTGELAILFMQVGTLLWWVGWSIRLVS